jgi:hypothetical protein
MFRGFLVQVQITNCQNSFLSKSNVEFVDYMSALKAGISDSRESLAIRGNNGQPAKSEKEYVF